MVFCFYKGGFLKIKVIKKEDKSIFFESILIYPYDLFNYAYIKLEFDSISNTITLVKNINLEIVNSLDKTFRLKNK